jgi:hypothetical protein
VCLIERPRPTAFSCCAALLAPLVDIIGDREMCCKLAMAVSFLHAIAPNFGSSVLHGFIQSLQWSEVGLFIPVCKKNATV